MKYILFFFLIFSFFSIGNTQNKKIPEWFLEEIAQEAGLWIADNSEYLSSQEPFDAYALEWKWGINKKSLMGRMYGLKDGKDSGTFWEFRKYWDAVNNKQVVMQFGSDGTIGIGTINKISEKESTLIQIFTNPDGTQYKIGHKTVKIDSITHKGSSFSINEQDEWTLNRSYTWKKE